MPAFFASLTTYLAIEDCRLQTDRLNGLSIGDSTIGVPVAALAASPNRQSAIVNP